MPGADPDPLTNASSAETVTHEPVIPRRMASARDVNPAGADPQVWNLLCQCRALTTLSPIALHDVLAAATERSFQPGDALVTQGDPAEGLLILLEGTAHALLRGQDGGDRCIGKFTSGDVVGEMALVTREPEARQSSPIRASVRCSFRPPHSTSWPGAIPSSAWCSPSSSRIDWGRALTTGSGASRWKDSAFFAASGAAACPSCTGRRTSPPANWSHSDDELSADLQLRRARALPSGSWILRAWTMRTSRTEAFVSAYHTYFLVMELCEGVDLQRLVSSRGRWPSRECGRFSGSWRARSSTSMSVASFTGT